MDQQTQIAQEANRKRDQFRGELVTVYARLEKFPTEPLPVPKTLATSSSDGPGTLAQNTEALLPPVPEAWANTECLPQLT
eukprot:4425734-Amphidinium_carterae.1